MKMKLTTVVSITPPEHLFSLSDKIVLLGSCFADNIAGKLAAAGFSICANPFGTLYNPLSILNAVRRLDSKTLFTKEDCVPMGAGAGRICSFEHHTSFSRETEEEFLENANAWLQQAREFWSQADRVIISLGTAMVWFSGGKAVSNCLKRPASEFSRRMLEISEINEALRSIIKAHPEKRFTITVSPIRHLGDGARTNTLSKARLLLAAAEYETAPAAASGNRASKLAVYPTPCTPVKGDIAVSAGCVRGGTASEAQRWGPKDVSGGWLPGAVSSVSADYFPAYEIMMDELRDYRFYADDLVHPSTAAIQYIWERFLETFVLPSDLPQIAANEKAARHSAHRHIL